MPAPDRTLADVETDLRRATIAIRVADAHCDCKRVVELRGQQDRWLDEWKQLARPCA